MLKTIVILANSVKHHQHCVAGKCIVTKEWIRPVSSASGEALSDEQTKYINPHGEFSVKKKQKIEMRFESHNPLPNQPENYLISDNKWVQKYSIDNCELEDYLDFPENLWGKWKSVSYDELCSGDIVINQSLYLVKVTKLNLYLAAVNKRRAKFVYNEIDYDFPVTDPKFVEYVSPDGVTHILCISLGEEYQGACYKIVAGLF